jgi:prepilin-type N-terminal cleavage/methylation domain-containing protein
VVIVPGAPIFSGARQRMKNISRISQHKHERARTRDNSVSARKGFTLVEILTAVAILGIMALIFYPNIMNTLESRKIEGSAREVLTILQRAKFQAVKTKLNHRVRFWAVGTGWVYVIEREDNPADWNTIRGFLRKSIPSEFQVNVDFPNEIVEFSPLGLVANYSSTQNSITLQSLKLETYGKPDQRIIKVIAGGSIQYIVAEGE